ncbi:hypothetical protein EV127DRAFT_208853 [Xylaria flabelliformis]|nr:hypothetical protein EV127DRAFT_208853 [Xylaria flabelliformis]
MELYSVSSKEASRIPTKPERSYISSLKSCSMETRRRPLRTYSKRTSTDSNEPTSKRRCIVETSTASIPNGEGHIAPSGSERNAMSSISKSHSLPPIKKGTITAYFGIITSQQPTVTPSSDSSSDPSSEPNEPATTPPSSPPVITTRKRRARRLKTRVVTQSIDEEEGDEEEQENQDSKKRSKRIRDVEPPTHTHPPVLSESTLDSLNQIRNVTSSRSGAGKPLENQQREKKQASVQTTLSLSMHETHYTECKECGMLYNHLHKTDIKYHARRHAALRRAKTQAGIKGDVAE